MGGTDSRADGGLQPGIYSGAYLPAFVWRGHRLAATDGLLLRVEAGLYGAGTEGDGKRIEGFGDVALCEGCDVCDAGGVWVAAREYAGRAGRKGGVLFAERSDDGRKLRALRQAHCAEGQREYGQPLCENDETEFALLAKLSQRGVLHAAV